jgi:hypothetical protein
MKEQVRCVTNNEFNYHFALIPENINAQRYPALQVLLNKLVCMFTANQITEPSTTEWQVFKILALFRPTTQLNCQPVVSVCLPLGAAFINNLSDPQTNTVETSLHNAF